MRSETASIWKKTLKAFEPNTERMNGRFLLNEVNDLKLENSYSP